MSSTLSAAIWYAEQGWPIIPVWGVDVDEEGNAKCHCGSDGCNAQGKHPVSWIGNEPMAPRGVKDATTDLGVIRDWWKRYPNANIGAAATQWFALDIDRPDARYELDALPDTVESISGSGGQHILFNQPKDWKVGNATGTLPPGIDVRGCANDGTPHGYIILAPSSHKSGKGKRYEWELSSHPRDVEIADAPDWLLQILRAANIDKERMELSDVAVPDLAIFDLSAATRSRILNGHPSGEDRSKMDMRVCCALVEASATPSEIAAIFNRYPIGTSGKMSDHNSPNNYLQRTIDSAFAWTTAKTPKRTIPSKVQPAAMVTEEEAAHEEVALAAAYKQGWSDALVNNPAIMEVLWPHFLQPSKETIEHFGIGVQMDMKFDTVPDNEYASLVIPYYIGGEVAALDFILHEPPDDYPPRLWKTNGTFPIFDTEFDRSKPISGSVVVAADFDEALRLTELGLAGYDILGQPASSLHPGQQGQRYKRMQALAELLSDADRIILAWPSSRRDEGKLLAGLLEAGSQRVRWASMPADLRGMFSIYSMRVEQLERILNMSSSVII